MTYRKSLLLAGLVVVSALAVACGGPTAPSNTQAFTVKDVVLGNGATATNGSTVNVNYTGWLYDSTKAANDYKGLQFDSSAGREPLSFTLGTNQVIKGFNDGVEGMRVGGTRILIIPPSLAYGSQRSGVIPPNATLVFQIDLVSVSVQ